MSSQRVNPAVLAPLQDALTVIYWYKQDLRTFLDSATGDRALVARLDWSQYKRAVVRQLVSTLAEDQHKYFDTLVNLLLATADVGDPVHLKRLEDGETKYREAVDAVEALRPQVEPYSRRRNQAEEADRRRRVARELAERRQAVAEELATLNGSFGLLRSMDPQPRGYALEDLLNRMFKLYDIDAKGPFRNVGEQIDGAFTFEGTEFLLEAKWQQPLSTTAELDAFVGKINRKLDNTLGLFVSVNGFQPNALSLTRQGARPSVLLMDGADIVVVLEDRLPLPELLTRKKQHAARTGEVFLSGWQILSG
jgi:hypothetical protein